MAVFLHDLLAWFVVIEAVYGMAMIGFGRYAWRHGGIKPWAVTAIFAVLLAWSQSVRTFRFVRPYHHYAFVWGFIPSLILLGVVYVWSRGEPKAIFFRMTATIPAIVTAGVVAYVMHYHNVYAVQKMISEASH